MNPKLRGCDDVDWIHLAQNRTNIMKLLRALEQFLTTTATVRFLTRTPVDGDILLAETTADWTGTTRIVNPGQQIHIWHSNFATRNPLRLKMSTATLTRSCHSLQRKPVAESDRQTADCLAASRPTAKPPNSSGLLFVS
jgi:hypothetical protein